jgi:O-6-methylguanine DNA methyltransferase
MVRSLETVFRTSVASPRGPLQVMTTTQGVCAMALPDGNSGRLDRWLAATFPGAAIVEDGAAPHVAEAREQLTGYFAGRRKRFDVPLDLRGTCFQQRVWTEVARIPFGVTRSFAALAAALGQVATPRAVSGAIHASPLPILVPSHRVVARRGAVRSGDTAGSLQRWLLALEGLLPEDDELPVRWYQRVQVQQRGPIYVGTPRSRTYCLPACIAVQAIPAAVPRLFRSIQEAREAGFRSCAICRPDTVIRRGPFSH